MSLCKNTSGIVSFFLLDEFPQGNSTTCDPFEFSHYDCAAGADRAREAFVNKNTFGQHVGADAMFI